MQTSLGIRRSRDRPAYTSQLTTIHEARVGVGTESSEEELPSRNSTVSCRLPRFTADTEAENNSPVTRCQKTVKKEDIPSVWVCFLPLVVSICGFLSGIAVVVICLWNIGFVPFFFWLEDGEPEPEPEPEPETSIDYYKRIAYESIYFLYYHLFKKFVQAAVTYVNDILEDYEDYDDTTYIS